MFSVLDDKMPIPMDRATSKHILRGWYKDPIVRAQIYRGLGVEGDIDTYRLAYDRGYADQMASYIKNWRIGIAGDGISSGNTKQDIRAEGYYVTRNKELLPIYLDNSTHVLEIHASQIKNDGIDFNLDVDRCLADKTIILCDQERIFHELDAFYRMIQRRLDELDIEHRDIITCKGVNILGQVRENSDVYRRLLDIAGPINQIMHCRTEFVPEHKEKAYKAMTRLIQYFFLSLIRYAREYYDENANQYEHPMRIEIADKYDDYAGSIACDSMSRRKRCNELSRGVEGSKYDRNKLRYSYCIPKSVIDSTPIPVRMPIGLRLNGRTINFFRNLSEAVGYRNDPHAAFEVIKHDSQIEGSGGRIPVCENGINNLINEYLESGLYHELHRVIDEIGYIPVNEWGWLNNKDFHEIARYFGDRKVADYVMCGFPKLLEPEPLDHTVHKLFGFFGGNFHHGNYDTNRDALANTIGFLANRYKSDPSFDIYFECNDPVTYAVGYTEIMLGQHFIDRFR